ncbi:exodeoxyribonuclease V subunit gamma [Rehaibacterium terrae]|jgi:exodeoxyribonuclease V gamma subunit|uniref:RecBCD enzyme subunit RecC n=1 Tax=Rehaibacterium terrae TaxID=1341696 RepID=A0A7W7XZX3_9GAMM|nr:exodeoxyribonuclease V subunit gamma [Rehaibacterium terrae]MBB5015537.1 exodeoxyribonuclease V gamma subunit [Rehaibacterium terrae]
MPAPDFRLCHGNDLDVLAGLLAEQLRAPAEGAGTLDPDLILIPQAAMKRWLVKVLAERHGIAANLEFLAPGEFVGRVLAANLPAGEDIASADPEILRWRLFAVLRDRDALAHPALAGVLAGYLDGAEAVLKAWCLAGELAEVFAKYQAWRRDWLLRWDDGADPHDWQAELWRRVTAGGRHRARAIDDFLRRHAGDDAPPPRGLPPRVFAFACINVSPDVLRVFAAAARACTLHFYLPTPTRKYWGDLRTLRERLAAGDSDPFEVGENPLLARWGRAGRDFVATLFADAGLTARETEAYVEPEQAGGLLQHLRRDLLERQPPPAEKELRRPLASLAGDRSLQVHACHTRLREVQVLHDQLRALLEDQPDLEPRQIAVMAPDIDLYAPYVAAVFGGAQGTPRFIPYTVADGSALATQPLADLCLRLLDLPSARFTANEVLDLLALPPVARQYGVDPERLDTLRGWLAAAGARWGLDADHRARLGAPGEHACTWAFAIERLLLGHAAGGDDDIAGVAPWPELEGGDLRALDALLRLLRTLASLARRFAEPQPPAVWKRALGEGLRALVSDTPAEPGDRRALERLDDELRRFAEAAAQAGVEAPVPPEVVRAHFRARLGEADTRQPFLSGGVTFCRMVPMRLIPFRVICLLGMNDGDYPRREPPAALNRLVAALDAPGQRRPGDRSVREDDRFLFLQLLNAADRVFYLSYLGRDAGDGSAREPSVLVSELLDEAACYFDDPEAARQRLVLHHPLQPFGAAPDADPRRAGFDPAWQLPRTPGAASMPAFAPAPLPAQAGSADIDYTALRRFLLDPPRAFLRGRLGLSIPERAARLPEDEPFAPADGFDASVLRQRVLIALADDDDLDRDALCRRLQAEAWLPPAAAGRLRLRELIDLAAPVAAAWRRHRRGEARAMPFALDLGETRLHGALDDGQADAFLRAKAGKPSGRDWLRWHLDALVLSALDEPRPLLAFADFGRDGHGPLALPRHAPEAAHAALRWLTGLMTRGLCQPLPFRPAAGHEWARAWDEAAHDEEREVRALERAKAKWRNQDDQGEGADPWTALALRGAEPFVDAAATARFGALARAIFAALREARVPEEAA